MRTPHRDASADGGRGGSRLGPLTGLALLALVSGCAIPPTPRIIDGESARARRVLIASASAAAGRAVAPGTTPATRGSDHAVKRAANGENVPVPSPPVIPGPAGEYPID